MNIAPVNMTQWDARLIIEALRVLNEKWVEIIKTTDDEDLKAEFGNDLFLVDMARERVEAAAVPIFGEQIKEFSRQPICAGKK